MRNERCRSKSARASNVRRGQPSVTYVYLLSRASDATAAPEQCSSTDSSDRHFCNCAAEPACAGRVHGRSESKVPFAVMAACAIMMKPCCTAWCMRRPAYECVPCERHDESASHLASANGLARRPETAFSAAGDAHVARHRRGAAAAGDDEVVALRLARDGLLDGLLKPLVAL